MSLRKIITEANPVLRKKAVRVKDFQDKTLQTLIDDMIETMLDAPGVGLAAPQVAVSQRVVVVKLPDDEHFREEYGDLVEQVFVVINPRITRASREMVEDVEGCLSIPNVMGKVDRHVSIEVKGQDRHGEDLVINAENWLARIFQHEIDHLDGILFTDKTENYWEIPKEEASEVIDEETVNES